MKRVLITDWGDGARFFHVWGQAQPQKTSEHRTSEHSALITTHIVALCPAPSAWAALSADVQQHLPELHKHWWGLSEGFHRFDLGCVQLTLCVGDPLSSLKALNAFFDDIWQGQAADKWWFKALAQHCQAGTRLQCVGEAAAPDILRQAGFVPDKPEQNHEPDLNAGTPWRYQPHWNIRRPRQVQTQRSVDAASPVLVIGAGLAGSSVAAALARRGHRVTVLDAAPHPAAGASGLPAGLMAPLLSRDDNPRSRLIRAGLRLSLQAVAGLREGYGITGLLEKNAAQALPPAADLMAWSAAHGDDVWHPHAAWVCPAALVKHWLATPGVTFQGNSQVARLSRHEDQWQAHNDQGQTLAQAPRVVLAHAMSSLALSAQVLPNLPAGVAQGMRGLVVMGEQPASNSNTNPSILPAHPINGNGGLIPHLPTQSGTAWVFGATYEASNPEPLNVDQHVQANHSKLAALLPELTGLMAGHLQTNTLAHWQGERCVTADRFPLLGPLDEAQTLWLCTGLGSRGLSFAALCAEQLAAQWHQEPAPLRTDLAKFVALDRLFRTK